MPYRLIAALSLFFTPVLVFMAMTGTATANDSELCQANLVTDQAKRLLNPIILGIPDRLDGFESGYEVYFNKDHLKSLENKGELLGKSTETKITRDQKNAVWDLSHDKHANTIKAITEGDIVTTDLGKELYQCPDIDCIAEKASKGMAIRPLNPKEMKERNLKIYSSRSIFTRGGAHCFDLYKDFLKDPILNGKKDAFLKNWELFYNQGCYFLSTRESFIPVHIEPSKENRRRHYGYVKTVRPVVKLVYDRDDIESPRDITDVAQDILAFTGLNIEMNALSEQSQQILIDQAAQHLHRFQRCHVSKHVSKKPSAAALPRSPFNSQYWPAGK